MQSKIKDNKDALYILIALGLGLLVGFALYLGAGDKATGLVDYIRPIATIFIRLLKMVIIPLVLSSIFMAVVSLGTPEKLGKMGLKTMAYFFVTTAIAVFWGIILVNLIKPGLGVGLEAAGLSGLGDSMASKVMENKGLYQTIISVLLDAIPQNPFESFAQGNVLQVIIYAICLGLIGIYYPKKSEPVIKLFASMEEMMLALTHAIMKIAPIGIFVLMVDIIAKSGFDAIVSLSKYMFTVIFGLLTHFIFLLIVGSVRGKKSPLSILKALAPALLTAFSTASSAATLPITMSCAEDNLGVNKDTVKFVIPLGATVNMDGTALYESVAAIFIAQAYGIELSLVQQIVIFLTASLAAIGAAAIPGAGLITMSIVLTAVGLPLDGIGLILAVDRILDMFRTSVNVFGDTIGSIVVDSALKDRL